MNISEMPVPAVYKEESDDFRFFLKWFENSLCRIQYDTENIPDLYDPLRCPDWLIWMLADTMGFKYDDRLPMSFNRLVLVYFMSMIRNKGSKDGVTLAAEVNLAQFNIINYGKEKDILNNRLEDTSIPVNSVFVTAHTPQGFIEVVYFSDKIPINACIEYVRPLGMYCFEHAGVRMDARTKIAIDAELTNSPNNLGMSIGPTHVGHYSREDYSRLQRIKDEEVLGTPQSSSYDNKTDDSDDVWVMRDSNQYPDYVHVEGHEQYAQLNEDVRERPDNYNQKTGANAGKTKREIYREDVLEKRRKSKDSYMDGEGNPHWDSPFEHDREPVYYRNSDYEQDPTENNYFDYINPGYRALYSLQLCNNEHIVKSLIPVLDEDGNEYDPDDPNKRYKERDPIFGLGYTPTDVSVYNRSDVYPLTDEAGLNDVPIVFTQNSKGSWRLTSGMSPDTVYNLRYDRMRDNYTASDWDSGIDVHTYDDDRTEAFKDAHQSGSKQYSGTPHTTPRPAVNPVMTYVGDAISLNSKNSQYILRTDADGTYPPTTDLIHGDIYDPDSPINENNQPETLAIYKIEPDGEVSNKVTDAADVEKD